MTRDEDWNAVDVNSSALMLGATEDGFMSLEVLDPSAASDSAANAARRRRRAAGTETTTRTALGGRNPRK